MVKHILKAVANNNPKSHADSLWDTNDLMTWLIENNSKNENRLWEILRHCANILLLYSGRRIHDPLLLSVGENFVYRSLTKI